MKWVWPKNQKKQRRTLKEVIRSSMLDPEESETPWLERSHPQGAPLSGAHGNSQNWRWKSGNEQNVKTPGLDDLTF